MHKHEPLVSILIPVYNSERYLAATLQSALRQTYSSCEIIAIDDGSTDGSADVLRSFDERITWSRQSNCGQAVTRNRLLARSRGTFLQFLDADDILAKDKISTQVGKLETESECDLCLDEMRLFYSSVDEACEVFPCPTDQDLWVALITISFPFTSAGLWRRSALEALDGWQEGLTSGHEYNRYFRLLQGNRKICFTKGGRTYYRMPNRSKPNMRDPVVTLRERLHLLDQIETHLHKSGSLIRERRLALGMTRLQIARAMWRHDRAAACGIAQKIALGDVTVGLASPAVPSSYVYVYKSLGFRIAQRLSALKSALAMNRVFNAE